MLKVPLAEQGGELVAVLRGAKAPLLQKMIVDELSKEKLVLEHGGERKAVRKAWCTVVHAVHDNQSSKHMVVFERQTESQHTI